MNVNHDARHLFEKMGDGPWSFSICVKRDGQSERIGQSLPKCSLEELTIAEAMAQSFLAETTKRREYLEYLEGPAWAELRRVLLSSADGCATCTSQSQLDVHHRTYERFGRENPDDLIVLCRKCHDKLHAVR